MAKKPDILTFSSHAQQASSNALAPSLSTPHHETLNDEAIPEDSTGELHPYLQQDGDAVTPAPVPGPPHLQDRRMTLRQRPPGLFISDAGIGLGLNIASTSLNGEEVSDTSPPFSGTPSDPASAPVSQGARDDTTIPPPGHPSQGLNSDDTALNLSSAGTRPESNHVTSELDPSKHLSPTPVYDDVYSMIGLRSPASPASSVVGGDFDDSWGTFSHRGRSRGDDVNFTPDPNQMPSSAENSPLPSGRSSPRTHIRETSMSEVQQLRNTIDRLMISEAGLQDELSQRDIDLRRASNELEHANGESQRLRTEFQGTLQAYNLHHHDNVQPTWKQDTDGTRLGPLYDDIPSIYRESTVEVLIGRTLLKCMLKDFDSMVVVALEALVEAEKLKFPPLTARCHFAYGVALYYTYRFEDAAQEFVLSYGHSEYGILDDFIQEWCDECTNGIQSSGNMSLYLATRDTAKNQHNAMDSSASTKARSLWGSPAEAKAILAASHDSATAAERRRRASTVVQPRNLSGMNTIITNRRKSSAVNDYSLMTAGASNDYAPNVSGLRSAISIASTIPSLSEELESADEAESSDNSEDDGGDPGAASNRPRADTTTRFASSLTDSSNLPTPEGTGQSNDPAVVTKRSRTDSSILNSKSIFDSTPDHPGNTSLFSSVPDSGRRLTDLSTNLDSTNPQSRLARDAQNGTSTHSTPRKRRQSSKAAHAEVEPFAGKRSWTTQLRDLDRRGNIEDWLQRNREVQKEQKRSQGDENKETGEPSM
ncbi:hypothetical protein ACLMJK_003401 [Lecanora helva]